MAKVFVFGSNLAGRHGKGSAKEALLHHGAIYGVGYGRQGNSFAIPTKGRTLKVLPLVEIEKFVLGFLGHAKNNPGDEFHVVPIGTGLASYKPRNIAKMFRGYPPNVILPKVFLDELHDGSLERE